MTKTPLPDAPDREKILSLLDKSLLVEAAAGTGKTTAMVGRVVNLLKHGRNNLAAVTFTRKAAAELRQRLETRIGQLLADSGGETSDAEKANLRSAAAALPDSHIGTIHSFCARLLRERPVEAGLSPDFRELDADEDALLRERAWKDFAGTLARGRHRDLHALFATFGLDLDTLGNGFLAFADYPDMDEWIGRDAGVHQIDVDAFLKGVRAYHGSLLPLANALENADPGTDALMPICQILLRRLPRLTMPLGLPEAHRLAGLFKSNPKITQKQWLAPAFGMDKTAVLEFADAYRRFHGETVQPFKNACLAAVHAAALEAYHLARDRYDAIRRESGLVNFQDLLLATARMLRDFPEVRADFAERYGRLLVDEVQDTDPVQAEIMFLLASAAPRERDWRKCPPRPGALFIVGDPKQSIYRFRRADIAVYQEIKRLILRSGGEVLGLSANFRSQPTVLQWVNETFRLRTEEGREPPPEAVAASGRFADAESAYSPAYVPLLPGVAEGGGEAFHGVFRLEAIDVSKKEGVSEQDVLRNEAERIARFIRRAIDAGLPLPGREGPRAARAGDFLVITYGKKRAALYAEAVRSAGLECRASGGGTLGGSEALRLLARYLTAIDNPEDPVALTAALRGGLFGVSDPELYAWKKAGNAFSYLWRGGEQEGIGRIFALMRAHAARLREDGPWAALGRIADDLGLWALAATGDDPPMDCGALALALDLLQREKEAAPTLAAVVERLEWLLDRCEKDPLPAVEGGDNAVRVMNLHKTKGLEAPVVFLACTRGMRKHAVGLAVRRSGETVRGGLALRGGAHGAELLARPPEWDEVAEEEALFLAAERTRLNYVAATRAGAALIVSVHKSEGKWGTAFLPQYAHGETIAQALPEPEDSGAAFAEEKAEKPDLALLDEWEAAAASRAAALAAPSYSVERAKQETDPPAFSTAGETAETPVPAALSAAYGEVLHRALLFPSGTGGEREALAALLREFELPAGFLPLVEETVRRVHASALWRKALHSPQMFQEAPFTLFDEGAGESPALLRGVIDLVFRNATGWTVVDFKSDAVGPSALAAAASRHAPQLRAYAAAWEKLTGEAVTETGIYFFHADAYFPL